MCSCFSLALEAVYCSCSSFMSWCILYTHHDIFTVLFLLYPPLLFDLFPLCKLLTMYHIGQPRWGDNKSLLDKAIYIGPVLTVWGWETGVEGRLVNTAEIAAACGSQEKLETTVPMKEKIVLEKKKKIVMWGDLNKNGPFLSNSPLFRIRSEMSSWCC